MGLDMYLTKNKKDKELMYWRKANAIHGWFVRNLNNGEEINVSYIPASREKLQQLIEDCKTVVASLEKDPNNHEVAMELIPPTGGFFFGSYEIDEWYIDDLKQTIQGIQKVLDENPKGRFYYYAWW